MGGGGSVRFQMFLGGCARGWAELFVSIVAEMSGLRRMLSEKGGREEEEEEGEGEKGGWDSVRLRVWSGREEMVGGIKTQEEVRNPCLRWKCN